MKDIRRPQMSWILAIPFDVADAALSKHLYGRNSGEIEYVRTQVVAGRIIYKLSNQYLGGFGEVEVRKRSDYVSELSFSAWALPPLSENRDEINRQRERQMRDVFDYVRWRLNEEEADLRVIAGLTQDKLNKVETAISLQANDDLIIGGDVVARDKVQVINHSPVSILIVVKPDGTKDS